MTYQRFLGTVDNSYANISAHYDLSNDMFSGAFLMSDVVKDKTPDFRFLIEGHVIFLRYL